MPDQGKRLVAARTAMLLSEPFWGALSMRLRLIEDKGVKTACTDGTRIRYNPDFCAPLTAPELRGLLAHETAHCAMGHPWRRGSRDPLKWNMACDHSLNHDLVAAGYTLPPGALMDPAYLGMSPEAIYPHMTSPPSGPSGEDPGDDPGGSGGVEDAPEGDDDDGDPPATREDWEQGVQIAEHQAKRAGHNPAGMDRLLNQVRNPTCRDLISALREFVGRSAKEDYSWRRPNPRYVAHGLYLPTMHSEAMPPVAVGVDTSGSIDIDCLSAYAGALQVVLDECRPEVMTVFSCDAYVHVTGNFEPGDTIPTDKSAYPGGGGTDFRPVFSAIDKASEQPCAAVYLTDLDGDFPNVAPSYPVLWVVYGQGTQRRSKAPFGETIWIE